MVRPQQQQQSGNRPLSPPQAPQPPQPSHAPQKAAAQQVGDAAQDLKDQVQETAGQATEQVKQSTQSFLGSQKDRATQSLKALADTMEQAGQQLAQSEGGSFFAFYINRAAASVQQLSGHLDEREVSELTSDLEQFARTRPAVFLSGTFAFGVLGARFLRSSGQRASSSDMNTSTRGNYPAPARPQSQATRPAASPSPQTSGSASRVPATPQTANTQHGTAPTRNAAANPQASSRAGSTPAPGENSAAQSAAAPHTGTAPAQPAPLLPPNLDPRPGQFNPNKPRA